MTKFMTNLPACTEDAIDLITRDFQRFFNSTFPDFSIHEIERNIEGYPVTNVYTNATGDLRFEIAVTGFAENEVSASIKDGFLIVKGEKSEKKEKPDTAWKIISGRLKKSSFEKRYRLSNKLNLDQISAKIENGVLSIEIKAKEETKPKAIEIDFKK